MIKYICKFCGQYMGEVNNENSYEYNLGFNYLTVTERENIITYELNGDMLVKVICEYCQEALEKNPELFLISNPLQ
ncbi:MAG: anti-sigma-F factor Fin [Vulcanibacillus sp.]